MRNIPFVCIVALCVALASSSTGWCLSTDGEVTFDNFAYLPSAITPGGGGLTGTTYLSSYTPPAAPTPSFTTPTPQATSQPLWAGAEFLPGVLVPSANDSVPQPVADITLSGLSNLVLTPVPYVGVGWNVLQTGFAVYQGNYGSAVLQNVPYANYGYFGLDTINAMSTPPAVPTSTPAPTTSSSASSGASSDSSTSTGSPWIGTVNPALVPGYY